MSTSAHQELSDKAATVVLARVSSMAMELVSMVVVVRLLTQAEVAVIGFLLLVYQSARQLACFGFPDSVFYFFERLETGQKRGFVQQSLGILALMGLLAAGLLILLAAFLPVVLSNWQAEPVAHAAQLTPVIALAAFLELPSSAAPNVLLALGRARESSLFQVLGSAGAAAALLVPLLAGHDIDVAVYALCAVAALRLVLSLLRLWQLLPASSGARPEGLLREQLRFSLPLGINAFTARLNKYADKFVVGALLSSTAFAHFHVGGQEIPFITTIPYAAGSVLISPYVHHQLRSDLPELVEVWFQGIRGVTLIVVPASALMILVAPEFIELLFGADYGPAVLPFQIYTAILLHRVAQYGALLQAFGDTRTILRLTLVILASNLLLSVPFTVLWGIAGTALATLISAMIGATFYLQRIAEHLQLSFAKVLPWGFYMRTLLGSAACALTAGVLQARLWAQLEALPRLALTSLSFLLLFLLVASQLGVLTRERRATARRWFTLRFLW